METTVFNIHYKSCINLRIFEINLILNKTVFTYLQDVRTGNFNKSYQPHKLASDVENKYANLLLVEERIYFLTD